MERFIVGFLIRENRS
uniref:Uncharacterized protein n=1 Tax=Anguilla anguilla TaxID=7936 RepID=A0A0E9XEJ7_ANGAN